jgi:hypothetical protein
MTLRGTPSRAISTACACRSWCGAKRRRTPARTARARKVARAAAGDHGRPWVGPSITHSSAPTGSATRARSHGSICSQAQRSMPTCRRLPLAVTDEATAARAVEVALGQRERLADPQAGPPEDDHEGAGPQAVRRVARGAHDGDDLFDLRRIGRIPKSLVPRRSTAMEAGHGGGRAASAGCVEKSRIDHRQTVPPDHSCAIPDRPLRRRAIVTALPLLPPSSSAGQWSG